MATRYDVSEVALQGGYTAKQCPARVQFDILRPAEPLDPPEYTQLIMSQGIEFEEESIQTLLQASANGWSVLGDSLDPSEAIAETLAAMKHGARIISGGFLPADKQGRRTGKPDLLVRSSGGYVPIDIKHHRTLDISEESATWVSDLHDPTPQAARSIGGLALRKHKGDALQLAHYWRMLEAIGYAGETPMGGILGKDAAIVWYDLNEPMWQTPARSDGKKRKTRTTLEIYDFEFDFRLDIAAVALQNLDNPDTDLLVAPVHCPECETCPWREHCDTQFQRGSGDPSLLPSIHFEQWRSLATAGITDRQGVADLHYPTASLAADGVDLPKLLASASNATPETPVGELIPRARKQQQILRDAGVHTARDAAERIDISTAHIAGGSWIARAILEARAILGPAPVYRRPSTGDHPIDRFDIEIDIDMESTPDGVYLWGALVTDRADTGLTEPGYRPFVSWNPITPSMEADVFQRFWNWLSTLINQAEAGGHTVGAYCWYDGAENPEMRRIAAREHLETEVEAFIVSDQWIDLRRVFNDRWITGGPTGLKTVARTAGFDWPVDEPGGAISMVWHATATGGTSDATQAQQWLLDYNRGDVEATLAVRDWLTDGHNWPLIPTT